MSLLADLLSKVKYKSASGGEGRRTDVPPDLRQVVSSYAEKEATKKRILILSFLGLVAIVAGFGTVYFMELYIKPSATKITRTTLPQQMETEPSPPKAEPPKPQVSITKPESSATKPKAAKPKPAKESPQQKKVPGPKIEEKKIAGQQRLEPKAEYIHKDAERKPAAIQEPQAKQQDSQKDVYLYTARTYESKKDYHQALLNYKKAMEFDPDNYIIMNNISGVLIHLGLFEEAIKYAKNVLAMKKDYVPSLINIGIAYIRLNNPVEGEAYLSKALSIEPSNIYALLNLGLLYEKQGDNDKAYGYFFKLSEMGNIQGHLGIARIAEKQGRGSDAVRIYREILSMNNIDPQTRKLVKDRLLLLGQ